MWRIIRLCPAAFADKETSCKYYFVDNGVLNLFLLDGDTALLENLTALTLFRKYGHDKDNERVFFYNDRSAEGRLLPAGRKKAEVDFYVPEDKLAIQTSFSISKAGSTREREVDALNKIPKVLACDRRIILTYEESDTITDDFGTIEVMPLWKWILGQ